jgi:hypothetical protein
LLGPADGRYLLRLSEQSGGEPSHVIVFSTLGAPERHRLARRRRPAPSQPEPEPVSTSRVTVIESRAPFDDATAAARWLRDAGEKELEQGLAVLNRVLYAHRLVSADPAVNPVFRHSALVARVGYGAGEQVADGLWTDAHELVPRAARRSRTKVMVPQARLAAVLGARERALACEELILRARLDVDQDRPREAALQLLVALDAALAELAVEPHAEQLRERLLELEDRRDAVAELAQSALAGPLSGAQLETLTGVLVRLESALRARVVLNA